jgi:hypothetical protein
VSDDQEASVVTQAVKKLAVVLLGVLAFVVLTADPASAACSYFGCSPVQGNPIRELAGMIVTMAVIAGLLYGVAKRYVD